MDDSSKDRIKSFYEKVSSDHALRARLEATEDSESFLDEAAKIASEQGVSLKRQDLEAAVKLSVGASAEQLGRTEAQAIRICITTRWTDVSRGDNPCGRRLRKR